MKRIVLLGCSIICIIYAIAQELQSPAQQVNMQIREVQKNPSIYLFAESTAETWATALDNAKFLLEVEVENFAKEQGQQDSVSGYITKAKNHILELKAMRGQRFRAFVYLKKSDLLPYGADDHVMVIPTKQETMVSSYTPEQSLPKQETVVTYTPAQDSPSQENVVVVYTPAQSTIELTDIETQMLDITSNNIGPFVKRLKSEGKISTFGTFRDMPANCNCVLFVYDRNQQLVACLRKTGEQYINLRTKQIDNITNYKGCGAIWLQPK